MPITTNFGAYDTGCSNADRAHDYSRYLVGGYTAHLALDLSRGAGQPVYAVGPGTVIYSGPKWGAQWADVVLVEHRFTSGDPFVVTYAHIRSGVVKGTSVADGARLGTVVDTGTGAHLHLGLRPGPGTTEQATIPDARIPGTTTCSLAGNTSGMVDPLVYLTPRPVTACQADINRSGVVNIYDLSSLVSDWGTRNARSDLNGDRMVNIFDLSSLISLWNKLCNAHGLVVRSLGSTSQPAAPLAAASQSTRVVLLDNTDMDAEVVGAATSGALFGNADQGGPAWQPVVWSSPGATPRAIRVSGLKDLVLRAVNADGLAVGTGVADTDPADEKAWYRTPQGNTGLLEPGLATRSFALDVTDTGQIVGHVYSDVDYPVIWDSPTATARALPVDTAPGGAVTAVSSTGLAAGALADDRLALWATDDTLSTPLSDGEAIDINARGDVLYASASNTWTQPQVRRHNGTSHRLIDLPGWKGSLISASAITTGGRVGGAQGPQPAVWTTGGTEAKPLPLPSGAQSGRVLRLSDDGSAYGWTVSYGKRSATVWTGIDLSPTPTQPPATEPPVKPRPSSVVKVKAKNHRSKLFVNVNPNKGSGYWRFKVQKKRASGSWKSLKTYRTKGKKETRLLNLKKGKYRVKVKSKFGYEGVTSKAVRLKR